VTADRLDAAVYARGLAPSREQARGMILAGDVRVDGIVVTKAGARVTPGTKIDVKAPPPYVSRGGLKLAAGLDALGWDVAGVEAIDVGASTGGFTDCLLKRGARAVISVDVGYGQLDARLRGDPRVTVLERVNARALQAGELPYAPDFMVADVSFISLTLVLGPVTALMRRPWRALVLVKPQFESAREDVPRGGVVRDPAVRAAAVERVARYAPDLGAAPLRAFDTGVPGPAGNHEYLLALVSDDHPLARERTDPRELARRAVA
jgi:23S rRNA (cytidine1920-2'-O)/16S rRNA (cytidine1409-2'-O)-methyltransferase